MKFREHLPWCKHPWRRGFYQLSLCSPDRRVREGLKSCVAPSSFLHRRHFLFPVHKSQGFLHPDIHSPQHGAGSHLLKTEGVSLSGGISPYQLSHPPAAPERGVEPGSSRSKSRPLTHHTILTPKKKYYFRENFPTICVNWKWHKTLNAWNSRRFFCFLIKG